MFPGFELPKNDKDLHGGKTLPDLLSISSKEESKEKFVVVENVGENNESVVYETTDTVKAYNFMDRNYHREEIDSLKVDVMLQLDDGTLTTEF